MRQLSLCILDYLSDSSIIYTAESGLWFFILSFLTLVSHLLPLGRETGGRAMLHSGLISSNSTHTFSSLFPNLHFSSKLQAHLRLWSFLAWLMAAFPAPKFLLQHIAPTPSHTNDPSVPLSHSPLSPSLCTEDQGDLALSWDVVGE